MASSAFKSTTKRTPIGASSSSSIDDSSSSSRSSLLRRSRSLSRVSRRFPGPSSDCSDEIPSSRGRFVNTTRGSGFTDISLDDLAVEFFGSGQRCRTALLDSEASPTTGDSLSQRRGRSVSRQASRISGVNGDVRGNVSGNSVREKVTSDFSGSSRRRRSLSVVRCQISDSESDLDHAENHRSTNPKSSSGGTDKSCVFHKPTASTHKQGMRRSLSLKDVKSFDGYSSQSSVLTDDEGRDAHYSKNGTEKTIRAVYAQKKAEHPIGDDGINDGLYEAMRKELRHAVEEIKTELGQAMGKTQSIVSDSDVLLAVASVKRNYTTKLEKSEKRKQDLLSEILLEEQRSKDLTKIVKELLPDISNRTLPEKPLRNRRRSTDRSRTSKRLTEEAEKYIEDFISNVEDTDISSLDGERSDTSSSLGGIPKTEALQRPALSTPRTPEMDGVALPWLQWETSNDASALTCKNKMELPITPKSMSCDTLREEAKVEDRNNNSASSRGSWSPINVDVEDRNNNSASSRGSWSPINVDVLSSNTQEITSKGLVSSRYQSPPSYSDGSKGRLFDMDAYLKLQKDEDLLMERFKLRQRISSGNLLLCNRMSF